MLDRTRPDESITNTIGAGPCPHCRMPLFLKRTWLGPVTSSGSLVDKDGDEHTVYVCREEIKMQRDVAEFALSRGRE